MLKICRHRLLEDYQKGEASTFVDHIKAGLTTSRQDPDSLLVFSGYVKLSYVRVRGPEADGS